MNRIVQTLFNQVKTHGGLVTVIIAYALVIAVINPYYETAFSDDWAYARMVGHLLETGQYSQESWVALNGPVHIWWGAMVAHMFGYSFTSLRISSLAMLLFGLIGFYLLARTHRLGNPTVAMLTLVLLASPLLLLMSFTYMTDAPFFAWLTLALWLYTLALQKSSLRLAFLASAAGAAAILIREYAVLLLPALGLVWLLGERKRRELLLIASGSILPAAAVLWLSLLPTSWTMQWVATTQTLYLRNLGTVIAQAIWRLMVILQYLTLFALPLMIMGVAEFAHYIRDARARPQDKAARKELVLLMILTLSVLGISLFGTLAMGERGLLPFVPWNLTDLLTAPKLALSGLTLLTTLGAIVLGRMIVLRYVQVSGQIESIPTREYLLDITTLAMAGVAAFQFQIGDRYFLPLLPYGLIVAGRHLSSWIERFRWHTVALSTIMLLVSTLWVRGTLEKYSVTWKASEMLRQQGISSEDIYGPVEWNLYQGEFDSYLKTTDHRLAPDARDNFYFVWRVDHLRKAEYLVTADLREVSASEWEVIGEIPYQDMFLSTQKVTLLRRRSPP